MAKRANPAKTRLLAKARKLSEGLRKYGAHGYVTRFDDYEADDRKLIRGIDSLHDLARKHGLSEDPDVLQYRLLLRQEFSAARERAQNARSAYLRVMAGEEPSIWGPRRAPDSTEQAFLEEMSVNAAKRSARSGRG